MKPSIATDQAEFAPLALTALEECIEESVYAPGYVQPYGALLMLQEPHLKIVQVSENVEQFFGLPATALLGQGLDKLFSLTQVKCIADLLLQDNLEYCNPFELEAWVKDPQPQPFSGQQREINLDGTPSLEGRAQTFRSTLHRTGEVLILELEPQPPTEKTQASQFYSCLQAAILSLRSAIDVSDLAQTLARKVKAITGFDRVMVYRFEADEHGVVIAEAKESRLESFLGLHYPATDIPVPARKLFLRNWVRQIPDINYTPARLIGINNAPNELPLDLSNCVLRGVSPCHVEYLQNMGVVGSLTISLIGDQCLWGLIACHHYSPKRVDYETRKTCEFLGQFASIELIHQQERELSRYRAQVKVIQDNLQKSFLRDPHLIQQVLIHHATQLLDLVHAEGVAIVLEQPIALIGQTPSLEEVQALLTWLPQLNQPDICLTDCLAQIYPPARAFKHTASGILMVAIVLHQKSYQLLWFRPEQIQTVNWAGDPRTNVLVDPEGERLTPRQSFALWQETVREKSLPWQAPEREAAQMMRNTLMLAVLEFSQAALEQTAARAAIANRAKSHFLAKMSHELRTPLNAILGFTQVMSRSPNTPAEFQEHLGIVSRSGEYLLVLINDVLEISSIEAGQQVLTECSFNLHRLLRSLQEMFALKASQNRLTLSFEKDQSVPHYVCSDEAKLRQILLNLISNAIKFTTQGSVTVQVRAEATSTPKQIDSSDLNTATPGHTFTLSVAVTDTGCGIGYQDWEAVFEAFVQTEQGRYAQGTGLGLSISRQFARLMGGDITVQSTVNQGSTFTCKVLVSQPETMTLAEPETTHLVVGLESGQPTYRLLVVEDVLENQQLLRTLLEPIGFEVQIVENGVEAIARWQQWQPHLILMDIQMPVMDGYEATRQIRLEEQKTVNGEERGDRSLAAPPSTPSPLITKIIALTAYAFEEDRTASLQAGCDDYLAKPFTEAALFEIIAYYLGVQYCYADQVSSEPATLVRKPLMTQDLYQMPLGWRTQVHEAALDLNDAKIRQLLAQISPQEQTLIEGITFLVDNFQLEEIATLTQP